MYDKNAGMGEPSHLGFLAEKLPGILRWDEEHQAPLAPLSPRRSAGTKSSSRNRAAVGWKVGSPICVPHAAASFVSADSRAPSCLRT